MANIKQIESLRVIVGSRKLTCSKCNKVIDEQWAVKKTDAVKNLEENYYLSHGKPYYLHELCDKIILAQG
jgi:hypothetical protein